ncbi:MAG TPA: branched-chain-amino-acid transaminase [Thermoanaerobaculia bacterium]|nr:branched-chain-amino-acid transaminase [Thermoanaerobaculia bacterium]
MNGRLVEFEKATIHVMTHGLHYGSGVFEGIRCYKTRQGSGVFRLPEHLERLYLSAKVYRMEMPLPAGDLSEAILETIRANELEACYIRPVVYRGFGPMGVNPLKNPVEVVIAVWPWGRYLGDESEQGVDVCVSSWRRQAPSSVPAVAKATGNYLNAQLIKMEAIANGYAEGIGLDINGQVSEGSGENIFLVKGGVLLTPPLAASILSGITRDAVFKMAADLGIEVREQSLPRGQLYTCDELFLTGTAAEITPIRSVDRIPIGNGRPGDVTRRLMERFRGVVTGEIEDRHGWLTPVGVAVAQ